MVEAKIIQAKIETEAHDAITRVAPSVKEARTMRALIQKIGMQLAIEARNIAGESGKLPDVDIQVRLIPHEKKE